MDKMEVIEKTDSEWKNLLSAQQYQVLRKKGTEPPRSGEYDKVRDFYDLISFVVSFNRPRLRSIDFNFSDFDK